MTYTLVLLRHGESEWNAKNLFTGWVDVALSEKGVEEAKRGGDAAHRRGRPARRRAHVAAASRHHDRQPRARRGRPPLDPRQALLAPERAALRRAAGQGQEADARRVRRGAVHALAPLLRLPAAGHRARLGVLAGRRPALRRRADPARRGARAGPRRARCRTGSRTSSRTSRPARPSWSRRTATRSAPWSSTWTTSTASTIAGINIPTGIPLLYTLDEKTLKPTNPGGTYLDPDAAAEAIKAVANQGR